MSNFVVEHQEGSEWVPKARCNFEDTDQFIIIAKNPMYRIREDGVDVTKRYRKMSKTSKDSDDINAASDPAMKPSQYKELDEQNKILIQHKVELFLENKKKRTEILKELNVSEATYDLIRSDMKQNTNSSNAKVNTPKQPSTRTDNKPYRGSLLGRR